MTKAIELCLVLALAGVQCLSAADLPIAVSPGGSDRLTLIADRCPTFSWGAWEGATAYELALFSLGDDQQIEPFLNQRFAGSVSSWTPSLERCLEGGEAYAWSVRAWTASKASEWSTPRLFQVALGATGVDAEKVVDVVVQRLSRQRDSIVPMPGNSQADAEVDGEQRSLETELAAAAIGTAALTVEGEIRTIDPSNEPRLWGRGRPGTDVYTKVGSSPLGLCEHNGIRFGLSRTMVDWGSAADACPAGTWVCRATERSSSNVRCNSAHPSAVFLDCSGAEQNFSDLGNQAGWLADGSESLGYYASEWYWDAVAETCHSLPVWCCSN